MTEDLTGVEIDQIYEKLLDLLLNEPINMDGLLAGAFNSAQMLSELLPLGQASMKVIAPPNVYLPKGEDKEYIFFQQESPDCKNPFIREFETQEGGTALITFLPLKGCLFSQTQTKLLSHYAKLLFTFGGRTRIGILSCTNQ